MTRTPNYFLFALSYFFFSYTNIFSRISPKNTTMLKMTINAEVSEVFKPRTDKTIIKNRVTKILNIQITYKVAIDMFNMVHITKIHPNSLMLFIAPGACGRHFQQHELNPALFAQLHHSMQAAQRLLFGFCC